MGQREGGDSPSSNKGPWYNFRWCKDGSPICSYFQKVGHKFRNCFMWEKAEAKKKNKEDSGQGNQTGCTQIVQLLPAEQMMVKEGVGNM